MSDVGLGDDGVQTAFPKNLQLDTLEQAKGFFADVIESYAVGAISERNLRAIVYALSAFLGFLKFEKDIELEAEIEEIKRRLEEMGR